MLAPFRGVRYAEDRVSGLAAVTCPPYDVITADNETRLGAPDPHSIARLTMPSGDHGQHGSPYGKAAAELAGWLAAGILIIDPEPALYVYEQADGEAVVQRGLIGALRLVPLSAGVILPHEDVAPGPVAGQRKLMESVRANLEPIFLLYEGGNGVSTGLVDRIADGRPPLAETLAPDGMRHRLWAITDQGQQAAIADDLAPRTALIADGHHRYAAYLQLQEQLGRAGPGPWDLGLALLVDAVAYPPRVGAIHRVIEGLTAEGAVKLASTAFCVQELPGGTTDLPAALGELATAGARGIAFLVTGAGRAFLLTNPDPALLAATVTSRPAELWQRTPGAVLECLLLRRTWGVADDERNVRALHDPALAVRMADSVPTGIAVLSCPMSAAQVYRVAALGQRVPRKSTSFGPKPRTGLVMRLFAVG